MSDEIDSYAEFEQELLELVKSGSEGNLDRVLMAGVLLDYRDRLKMAHLSEEKLP
jgi:hypothetical protein